MPCQLTIARRDLPPDKALLRKRLLSFDDDRDVTVGGTPDAACRLEGPPDLAATIRRDGEDAYCLLPSADGLLLNGQTAACGDCLPLHSGDALTVGDWRLQFYVRLPKVGQSWQSALLARLSQVAIAVILLTVLASAIWLPDYFRHTSGWGSAATIEQLAQRLDDTRSRLAQADLGDQATLLDQLLVEQLKADLNARIRHMRNYDQRLSKTQLRQMESQLDTLAGLLRQVQEGSLFPPLPKPAIDTAVQRILQRPPG